MGYDGYQVENALYGYKTELKEKLNDDEPPSWLMDRREWEEKRDDRVGFTIEVDFEKKRINQLGQNDKKKFKKLPKNIRDKCEEWLENHRENIERDNGPDFIQFSHFSLSIRLNDNDTIRDVNMFAYFKNH